MPLGVPRIRVVPEVVCTWDEASLRHFLTAGKISTIGAQKLAADLGKDEGTVPGENLAFLAQALNNDELEKYATAAGCSVMDSIKFRMAVVKGNWVV